MPPLTLLIIYLLTLLLIPVKISLAFISVRSIDTSKDEVRFARSLQVIGSVSLFFSLYFMILSAGGIKGAILLGPAAIVFNVVAFLLFAASITMDVTLFLYTANPIKLEKSLTYLSYINGGLYVTFFVSLITMGHFLQGPLQAALTKDLQIIKSTLPGQ